MDFSIDFNHSSNMVGGYSSQINRQLLERLREGIQKEKQQISGVVEKQNALKKEIESDEEFLKNNRFHGDVSFLSRRINELKQKIMVISRQERDKRVLLEKYKEAIGVLQNEINTLGVEERSSRESFSKKLQELVSLEEKNHLTQERLKANEMKEIAKLRNDQKLIENNITAAKRLVEKEFERKRASLIAKIRFLEEESRSLESQRQALKKKENSDGSDVLIKNILSKIAEVESSLPQKVAEARESLIKKKENFIGNIDGKIRLLKKKEKQNELEIKNRIEALESKIKQMTSEKLAGLRKENQETMEEEQRVMDSLASQKLQFSREFERKSKEFDNARDLIEANFKKAQIVELKKAEESCNDKIAKLENKIPFVLRGEKGKLSEVISRKKQELQEKKQKILQEAEEVISKQEKGVAEEERRRLNGVSVRVPELESKIRKAYEQIMAEESKAGKQLAAEKIGKLEGDFDNFSREAKKKIEQETMERVGALRLQIEELKKSLREEKQDILRVGRRLKKNNLNNITKEFEEFRDRYVSEVNKINSRLGELEGHRGVLEKKKEGLSYVVARLADKRIKGLEARKLDEIKKLELRLKKEVEALRDEEKRFDEGYLAAQKKSKERILESEKNRLKLYERELEKEKEKQASEKILLEKQKQNLDNLLLSQKAKLESYKKQIELDFEKKLQIKKKEIESKGMKRIAQLRARIPLVEARARQNLEELGRKSKEFDKIISAKKKELEEEKGRIHRELESLKEKKSGLGGKVPVLERSIESYHKLRPMVEGKLQRLGATLEEIEKVRARDRVHLNDLKILEQKKRKIEGDKAVLRKELDQLILAFRGNLKPEVQIRWKTRFKWKERIKEKIVNKIKWKTKNQPVENKEEMKKFLKEVDDLLGKLPEKEIAEFSKSKAFLAYKRIMNRYGVKS